MIRDSKSIRLKNRDDFCWFMPWIVYESLVIYFCFVDNNKVGNFLIYVHIIDKMSFRDTFTRSSNSSENLRYDDAAAYHFYVTVLLILGIPLAWSILKTILNPFSHIPSLSEL